VHIIKNFFLKIKIICSEISISCLIWLYFWFIWKSKWPFQS